MPLGGCKSFLGGAYPPARTPPENLCLLVTQTLPLLNPNRNHNSNPNWINKKIQKETTLENQ
jgi:hypothetical protein